MPKSFAVLCIALLLSACGQSGALYLPDRATPPTKAKDKPAKVVPIRPPDASTPDPAATAKPDEATLAPTPPSP